MTESETARILMAITGIFSSFRPNEMTLPMWQRLLSAVPMRDVISALDTWVVGGAEFAPTPGQLLKILERRTLSADDRVTADEAWAMAETAAQNGTLEGLTHQRTLTAISYIGFNRIRYADLEREIHFVRRDFIVAYNRNLEREELDRAALPAPRKVQEVVLGLAKQKAIA